MGQAMRIAQYDRALNERNAVSALQMNGEPLHWFRLDDGVMGGRSETHHAVLTTVAGTGNNAETDTDADTTLSSAGKVLHFAGIINTDGGGFASIRSRLTEAQRSFLLSPLSSSSTSTNAIQLRLRGDGKTYKLFFTDGSRAGPMARRPSWQIDIPTLDYVSNRPDVSVPSTAADDAADGATNEWQEVILPLDRLLPSFAGSRPMSDEEKRSYRFDPNEIAEMGVMLSLKLADGSSNPAHTFGQGSFPFSLHIHSIEPVSAPPTCSS